ncbi:MAG: hypothetical protein IKK01_08460, partial [Clostridia bacterium]|nr:hypothetical protein [Clostridia bacterium]
MTASCLTKYVKHLTAIFPILSNIKNELAQSQLIQVADKAPSKADVCQFGQKAERYVSTNTSGSNDPLVFVRT